MVSRSPQWTQARKAGARPPVETLEAAPSFVTDDDRVFLERLDDAHRRFLDHAEYLLNHSRVTLRTYKGAYADFRRFLLDRAEDPPRLTLSSKAYLLDTWILRNRKRGLSAITTNTYWRSLRPFFHFLERTEGFSNPYHGAKAPSFRLPLPKALKAPDLLRILEAARNYPWPTVYQRERAVALFGTMIYAGLRRSELLSLLFADVSLSDGTIRVRRGKGRFGGKDRTAYVCPELRAILTTFLRERARAGFTCPELFASRANRGLSVNQLKRFTILIRRASGVAFSPHALRHSFVTMLLRSGVSINVAQELAGHASITTTAGYLRVWDEDKKAQIGRLRLQ